MGETEWRVMAYHTKILALAIASCLLCLAAAMGPPPGPNNIALCPVTGLKLPTLASPDSSLVPGSVYPPSQQGRSLPVQRADTSPHESCAFPSLLVSFCTRLTPLSASLQSCPPS